jgi:hypothetical protein
MAYNEFTKGTPVVSQDINDFTDSTRKNVMALRDALVMGQMPGWDYEPFNPLSGTNAQPDIALWTKGITRLLGALTWGTTGGEDGNITEEIWQITYNKDAGTVVWEDIGTKTITYDANGDVTSITWS